MNHGERARALRQSVLDTADELAPVIGVTRDTARRLLVTAFNAGYEAAEPKLCARCGATVESGKDGVE